MRFTSTPYSEIFKINAYWFGLSFLWNGLHQLILPAVLLNYVKDQDKNTALGLLTFLGLFIAAIIQPIFGTISDHWRSKWGRRRPLILLGTLGDYVFIAVLAWSGGLVWVAIGYIGLQLTSNIAQGSAQGLLPDRVSRPQLGVASGIKNLMDMTGLIAAMVILGRVFKPDTNNLLQVMVLTALALTIGGLVTLLGVREQPSSELTSQEHFSDNLVRENPTSSKEQVSAYTWLLASRFIFLFGVYGVQGFVQYFIRDVIKASNPISLTANLLSVIILALMAFAVLGGWLGDRIEHQRILYIASFLGMVGSLLLIGARTPMSLLIYGSIFGSGLGLFLTSNWALANLIAPSDQAGKYLGLSNLATAGAGAIARLNGPLVDILNRGHPTTYPGYTFLFIVGAISIFISALLVRQIRSQTFTRNTVKVS